MSICTGIPGRPCPRDNAKAVVRGLCRTCQYRERRARETGSVIPAQEANKIAAAPFLAHLDRAIASHNTIAVNRNREPVDKEGTLSDVTGIAWDEPAYGALSKKIKAARETGTVDVYFADEFCCKYFKTHPFFVFGEAWFEHAEATFTEEVSDAA